MNGMSGVDRQMFGAQVVSKTMDYLNNSSSPGFAPMGATDKQTFGAQVVSKTMEYMNTGGGRDASGMSATYSFNKDVLGAYATGKGALANMYV